MKTRDHLRVITSTKRSFWAFLALIATCGLALNSRATVLINDTWQDGERAQPFTTLTSPFTTTYSENGTDQDTVPDGDLESAWFQGGGGGLVTTPGHMVMTNLATGSTSFTTYIAPDATQLTLANTGDSLKVTWVFALPGAAAVVNSSQNMRFALASAPTRITTDNNAPPDQATSGYALFTNMSTVTGRSTPFQLLRRTGLNGNFLATSGNWTSVANAPGFGNNATGYAYNTGALYTNIWQLTLLSGGSLEVKVSLAGDNLNGTGLVSITFTDAVPASLSYDTFGLRPSNSSTTAEKFDTSLFRVELTLVPEPSTLALAGIGLGLMLGLVRRRRR